MSMAALFRDTIRQIDYLSEAGEIDAMQPLNRRRSELLGTCTTHVIPGKLTYTYSRVDFVDGSFFKDGFASEAGALRSDNRYPLGHPLFIGKGKPKQADPYPALKEKIDPREIVTC